jgi:hypothetical protein
MEPRTFRTGTRGRSLASEGRAHDEGQHHEVLGPGAQEQVPTPLQLQLLLANE